MTDQERPAEPDDAAPDADATTEPPAIADKADEDVRRSRKRMIQPRRPATPEEAAKRAAAREAAAADDSVVIRTRKLTKAYGELIAVDKLDLEVRRGEVFGLLGQNGAGKTTTILMLLGLTEVTDGEARVVGLDPTRRPLQVKRRVGYLPDSVGFYDDLTGRENLRYTARLNRIPEKEANATIEAVLDQVGLLGRADDRTDTYSRGMIQRLGIADALVKDPDVLILDEPTTAIDPLGVVEILELLRRVVDDRGTAILLSSHLLNQVQEVCDRIGIFADGRLIGQGTLPGSRCASARPAPDRARVRVRRAGAATRPKASSAGSTASRASATRPPQGPVARPRCGPRARRRGPQCDHPGDPRP
jgi:ABC-2 type transport system ATP-binding protein